MQRLFSYGTLQQKNVQLANFGRELKGQPDKLPKYRVDKILITDKRVLRESGQLCILFSNIQETSKIA